MARMNIQPGDESKLVITQDAYGNLVGKEIGNLDIKSWIQGLAPRTHVTSKAFCTSCGACVDGSWEGARAKCECGWVGYFPDLRFKRQVI